jgi:predicted transcriptional regulator/transcriptional regulator with XRE-family HTH domain
MNDAVKLGGKVRALRRRDGLSQVQLAEKLGISASYLNLIESNKRPLPAAVLIQLAHIFNVDLTTFASPDDARLAADLSEAFIDPIFETHGLTNTDVREFAASSPAMARATLTLYRAYVATRDATQALAMRLSDGGRGELDLSGIPSEEVSDFMQRHRNHFPAIEEAAEQLWREARLEADDVYGGLVQHLIRKHGTTVRLVRVADERKAMRRYDPLKKTLAISEVLPPRSRRFQVAHQLGLIELSHLFNDIVQADTQLTTKESQSLARVALANYFASAVLMPYEPFLEAARAERYDIELLAHRYGASFEQVCHRLTSLGRKGREGVPFHMLRIDMAGNISKRFSNSGIRIARFSGACPRWNIHAAFLTPGMIRVQISRMPDGAVYFCLARTIRSDRGGYNVPHTIHAIGMGCELRHARELVYSDGVDLDNLEAVVPVGVTCRLCEHLDCAQRAFPPLLHPLRVEENVRGVSFYAPVSANEGRSS